MATQLPSQKRSEGQWEEWRRQRNHKHYSQHVMKNKEQHWRVWLRGDDPMLIRLADIAVSAGLRWYWKNRGGERCSAGSNTTQPSLPLPRVHQNPQMSGGGTRQRPSRVRSFCELQQRKFGPLPRQLTPVLHHWMLSEYEYFLPRSQEWQAGGTLPAGLWFQTESIRAHQPYS